MASTLDTSRVCLSYTFRPCHNVNADFDFAQENTTVWSQPEIESLNIFRAQHEHSCAERCWCFWWGWKWNFVEREVEVVTEKATTSLIEFTFHKTLPFYKQVNDDDVESGAVWESKDFMKYERVKVLCKIMRTQ